MAKAGSTYRANTVQLPIWGVTTSATVSSGRCRKFTFSWFGVSISGRRARCFAAKVGGVVVAATIDNWRGQPGKQRLRPFGAVDPGGTG